jgi:tRNA U34 5-methylaminomethyl-2-thiouridine-forming methyltransferase MnmC
MEWSCQKEETTKKEDDERRRVMKKLSIRRLDATSSSHLVINAFSAEKNPTKYNQKFVQDMYVIKKLDVRLYGQSQVHHVRRWGNTR